VALSIVLNAAMFVSEVWRTVGILGSGVVNIGGSLLSARADILISLSVL
jgi:hypothetical protein